VGPPTSGADPGTTPATPHTAEGAALTPSALVEPEPASTRRPRGRVLGGRAALGVVVGGGVMAWRWTAAPASAPAPPAAVGAVEPPVPPPPLADDPWGARPGASAVALTAAGPPVSDATARAELAAALPHLPADTSFVMGVSVGELRRDPRFQAMFDALGRSPQLAPLLAFAPPSMVKSAPARKPDFLPDVMTAPFTASFVVKSSTHLPNSSINAPFHTFIDASGRSIVRSAMPSASISTEKVV
jgi:hypothetical protein